MAKSSIPGPDEALAGMAKQGRTPMMKDGIAFTATAAQGKLSGTLWKKKNTAAGDPNGSKGTSRANVPATNKDRLGAAYSIKASYTKITDPAAGMTQANGKIVATATKRDRMNFDGGSSASY
jgi:hypothetical protein